MGGPHGRAAAAAWAHHLNPSSPRPPPSPPPPPPPNKGARLRLTPFLAPVLPLLAVLGVKHPRLGWFLGWVKDGWEPQHLSWKTNIRHTRSAAPNQQPAPGLTRCVVAKLGLLVQRIHLQHVLPAFLGVWRVVFVIRVRESAVLSAQSCKVQQASPAPPPSRALPGPKNMQEKTRHETPSTGRISSAALSNSTCAAGWRICVRLCMCMHVHVKITSGSSHGQPWLTRPALQSSASAARGRRSRAAPVCTSHPSVNSHPRRA